MATNRSPIHTCLPVIGVAILTVANTARDGSGAFKDLIKVDSGWLNGVRLQWINLVGAGAVTQGKIRIFFDDGKTSTKILWAEVDVTATTPSATVSVWSDTWEPLYPIALPPGSRVFATTHIAETFHLTAHGGSFEQEVQAGV